MGAAKQYVLFDHDGVLVDTEYWYFKAAERALAEVGVVLDRERYLADMASGAGTWAQATAAGMDEPTLAALRAARNAHYQHFLRTESIEIDGVVDVLAELSSRVRMAIVTTAKREDFALIHGRPTITRFMDFVLLRDDYPRPKPAPDPYLTALQRFGAPASAALVVEDSARGLRSAVAAGIDCVVVHNEFTQSQDFSAARHRIRTLAELTDLV